MTIAADTPLAELATTVPGAARVLSRHRLDFCCRGEQSLREACEARRLPADDVLGEIRSAAEPASDLVGWDDAPLDALIDHILERYHAPLRAEVPRLIALAEKVERVHGEKASCPRGLAAHLRGMETAIEEHLQKEEQILFPMIRLGRGALAQMPIRVMQHEHVDHGENLERVRALAHDLVPPAEACASWRALYLGLTELERSLHEHIALENHVLFPRALRS